MSRRILVLKPSSFGDIIHTLPAVAWIKQARPTWQLSWLVNTEWAPLLEGNQALAKLVRFPRQQFRGAAGKLAFIRWIKESRSSWAADDALDFQGLLRTALLSRLSGAKNVYGLADGREGATWFYSKRTAIPPGVPHAIERYLALAADTLGGETATPSTLEFPLPPGYAPTVPLDPVHGKYVLLHPFSRGQGKSLTPAQVEDICRDLAAVKPVVLIGRAEDNAKISLPNGCKNLLNSTSLNELIWLVRHASFMISVDSGPMHLGAALNCPLVGIHTWSDPRKVGPYRADAWVWKNGSLFRFADRHQMDAALYDQPSQRVPGRKSLAAIVELAATYPD